VSEADAATPPTMELPVELPPGALHEKPELLRRPSPWRRRFADTRL
jgi:hypothetical protein